MAPLQNPKPFPPSLSSFLRSFSSHASIPNQAQLLSLPLVSYFHYSLSKRKNPLNSSLSLSSPTSITLQVLFKQEEKYT
jgi:hypothetical protein